ncbi:MAG: GntR family transcriptional regulator [Candidatus Cloacimonetes bacterium]|jgi:DNA-binding transcriptional regulator YhcF (GntR family)|nr:GntR family transcriptional regulator [Candidatus Cloacimonadota bacterium]MBT4333083.1 GntR family transcriptional regulator [Candidatus Cloacimonadota bacterium]MBT4574996.1 GntR family transcriptional regulator [Candidatus Cloacimonadota bacterium]MBT5420703.1 GntR family transcriptional regulator [Candidatus Cloacimonadota bacterium]
MKFDESTPIYLQIKDEIEKAIIFGSLEEEEAVPSIRIMAKQYRLNPQTVSNAISELLNEGILFKKRGIGMFVEKGAQKKLKAKTYDEFIEADLRKLVSKSRSLGVSKLDLVKLIEESYDRGGEK